MVQVTRKAAALQTDYTPHPAPLADPPGGKARGRPSGYTDEIAEHIFASLGRGELMRNVCKQPGMPSVATVHRWAEESETFREAFARARVNQAHALAEETLSLAAEARDETTEGIAARRLEVDTRKWFVSKIAPKLYGDRLDVQHGGSVTLEAMVAASLPAASSSPALAPPDDIIDGEYRETS